MSYRTKKVWYHVRPGLKDILVEAGIHGVTFYEAIGISSATFWRIVGGDPFVSGEIRQNVIDGVVAMCGEECRARAEALFDEVPNAEVRVNGDKQVQTRLRNLARKHGLTTFEYMAKLVEGPRDPLELLNGRRRASGCK